MEVPDESIAIVRALPGRRFCNNPPACYARGSISAANRIAYSIRE